MKRDAQDLIAQIAVAIAPAVFAEYWRFEAESPEDADALVGHLQSAAYEAIGICMDAHQKYAEQWYGINYDYDADED